MFAPHVKGQDLGETPCPQAGNGHARSPPGGTIRFVGVDDHIGPPHVGISSGERERERLPGGESLPFVMACLVYWPMRYRWRMTATWARVALPWGSRVVSVMPEMMPLPTAQVMGVTA